MNIKIEKLASGNVRIELTVESSKKPLLIELTAQQLSTLLPLLQTAQKAERFLFQIEQIEL